MLSARRLAVLVCSAVAMLAIAPRSSLAVAVDHSGHSHNGGGLAAAAAQAAANLELARREQDASEEDNSFAQALAEHVPYSPYVELEKRQVKVAAAPSAAQDLVVLQFALLLEQLESTFYQQGLTKFGADAFTAAGIPVAVRNQFQVILLDELTHVSFLQQVITKAGAVPNLPCTFNFAAALATVQSFVTFAAILERTGVQAYDGAIHLVTPNTGTAGAAIATVEGRHSSFLNLLTLGNAAPGPFDTPLGIRPIVSIAAPLITTCPAGVLNVGGAAPVVPFPPITIGLANPNQIMAGTNLPLLFTPAAPVANVNALFCDFAFGLQQVRTPVVATTVAQMQAMGMNLDMTAIGQAVGVSAGVNRRGLSRRQVAAGTMVPVCMVPLTMTGFNQVVMFVVNADRDVTLDDDANVIAGPLTINLTT